MGEDIALGSMLSTDEKDRFANKGGNESATEDRLPGIGAEAHLVEEMKVLKLWSEGALETIL